MLSLLYISQLCNNLIELEPVAKHTVSIGTLNLAAPRYLDEAAPIVVVHSLWNNAPPRLYGTCGKEQYKATQGRTVKRGRFEW